MKAKLALIAPAMFNWSETQRMVNIALSLKSLGFKIIFLGDGRYSDTVDQHNFLRLSLNNDKAWFTSLRIQKMLNIDRYGNNYATASEIFNIVNAEIQLIDLLNPHVIVTGYRTTLSISARATNVPLVWCLSAVITPMYFCSGLASYPQNMKMHTFLKNFKSEEIKQQYIQKFLNLSVKSICATSKEWNKVLKKLNLPLFKSDMDVFTGDLNLMTDAAEIFPECFQNVDQYKFCGPLFNKPHIVLPDCVAHIQDNKKLSILVVLGSSGHRDIFIKILNSLLGLNANIYIAKVGILTKEDESQYPENFHFCEAFPLVETMRRMDLCIIHGGQGTMYDNIISGKPFIGVPMFNEQQFNLENICRFGVGKVIYQKDINEKNMIMAINEIIKDKRYAENMATLKSMLSKYYYDKKYDASVIAAQYIEDFLDGVS